MISLDRNNPEFQANLLALPKEEAWAVLNTLRRLQAMDWRYGHWLRFLSLHHDHDAAYGQRDPRNSQPPRRRD